MRMVTNGDNIAQPSSAQPIAPWTGVATTMEGFAVAQEKRAINAECIRLCEVVEAANRRWGELQALLSSTPDMLEKASVLREMASICELADRVKQRRDELLQRLRELV
jgi:hypothetical protein